MGILAEKEISSESQSISDHAEKRERTKKIGLEQNSSKDIKKPYDRLQTVQEEVKGI